MLTEGNGLWAKSLGYQMRYYASRGLVIHHWGSFGIVSIPPHLCHRERYKWSGHRGAGSVLLTDFSPVFFVVPDTMFGCQFKSS